MKYNVSVLFHGLYDEENYRQTAILEDLLTLNNDADGQDSKQAINGKIGKSCCTRLNNDIQ